MYIYIELFTTRSPDVKDSYSKSDAIIYYDC